ncbi:hypothetical protein NS220_08795 [Microbacterium testaceum]|uniref:Short-chain dehydrogenase n=1 Tax=Microbacterium testaceum TaxID=2033 RepID=A0A147EXJ2_MICTE|nr:SDR family NAD(P)-dependent oxidoreductase [Microbacterium testaceum]KTR94580.1 hypothetical protein NS220_08795 [Microbacterium testaceum]
MSFADKVVVVTGGASGIGEATAKLLAERGAKVVIGDVVEAAGERVVAEISAAGGTASFLRTDVAQAADTVALVDHAVATYGGLHLAANIAGIGHPPARMHELDEAWWDRIHDIDLKGMWLSMRAEIAYFLAHGGGAIVNMASGAGQRATLGQPAYAAAKAGVISLTGQAALEYARDNIRVNAVAPGLIETPAVAALDEQTRAMYAAQMPIGRMGQPREIATTVAWLLSDDASFVTGITHNTDGGFTQKS